mmetsp:Transcript_51124/g.116218  ORF Transcript_51124/g.116218 Transcript_51124/m.116218 type:complete len:257 (-) Transcript_51124:358-1128(-)
MRRAGGAGPCLRLLPPGPAWATLCGPSRGSRAPCWPPWRSPSKAAPWRKATGGKPSPRRRQRTAGKATRPRRRRSSSSATRRSKPSSGRRRGTARVAPRAAPPHLLASLSASPMGRGRPRVRRGTNLGAQQAPSWTLQGGTSFGATRPRSNRWCPRTKHWGVARPLQTSRRSRGALWRARGRPNRSSGRALRVTRWAAGRPRPPTAARVPPTLHMARRRPGGTNTALAQRSGGLEGPRGDAATQLRRHTRRKALGF